MDTKLVLIDGNSIFYREYYALPTSLKNNSGEPTNAIYGFANLLVKIMKDLSPSHIAVAFDVSKKTFRNDIYDKYKATRKPMPDDLRSQIKPLKNMLSLMKISCLEKEGLEGDDILGTIAKRFDVPTIIVTGDRDSYQLVDDTTKVCLNKKGMSETKILGPAEIKEMFGLEPSQMVYLKSLQGDTADNIPGVPGVGEKTALNLIQTYGSLDAVYQNLDSIKGSLHDKLESGKELAYISEKLSRINCSVEIPCKFEDLLVKIPFGKDVYDFFKFNNFRSLLSRNELFDLGAFENKTEEKQKVEIKAKKVEIKTMSDLEGLVKSLSGTKEFAFLFNDTNFFISDGKTEFIVDFSSDLLSAGLTPEEFFETAKILFENQNINKIVFDSKEVMHMLKKYDVKLLNYFDCKIAHHLASGLSVTKMKEVFDDLELNEEYKAKSLVVAKVLLSESLENFEMVKLYNDIELPLAKVLFEMEETGFKTDLEKLNKLEEKYTLEIKELEQKIYLEAGHEFNINSPKQLAVVLFDELHLKKSKKKSTNVDILEEIEDRNPIVSLVLRYRKIAKFLSSFITGLKPHIDKNGFIHTTFNQTLTQTGRLSSSDPNLQNIPIRGDESRDIRSIFVASNKDNILIDADYSQIELRLLAHLSEDDLLLKAFKENIDVHTQTACAVFGVEAKDVTPEMRRKAKVVNFGVNYGISDFGLAKDLKVPVYEAKLYIDTYYNVHPKIKEFMENQIQIAKETGRVSTMFGRTRKMLEIGSTNYQIRSRAERASQNMPLQGSASDIIKIAMIRISDRLTSEGFNAKLIMQIHDELIVDCPKIELDKVKTIVDYEMENATKLIIPLIADCSTAYRWSDAH